jgi:hypothetical protein
MSSNQEIPPELLQSSLKSAEPKPRFLTDFETEAHFSALIPRERRVLIAERDRPEETGLIIKRNFETTTFSKDLRFFSPHSERGEVESFGGIWCPNAFGSYSAEEIQRILGGFLRALVPKRGILFAASKLPEAAYLSLLRQSGFSVVSHAKRQVGEVDWRTVLAQRV